AAATQSGGSWLSVNPTTATAPSTVTVNISAAALSPGNYSGTVTITAAQGSGATNSPQVLAVSLVVGTPTITQNGVVNGASFSKDAVVSPGSIVSLFGTNLAAATAVAASTSLPTTLGGTQVLVNGAAVPLFFVSATQINFQMPPGIPGSTAQVIGVSNGISSPAVTVNLASAVPGIFTVVPGGSGQGAVLNQDSSVNSALNPASLGSVIQIFATGLGATNPTAVAGQPAGTSPVSV